MTDAGFMNSIVLAGRAFKAAKGKNPAIEGKDLANYLLSDRPLGLMERQLLAELILGEWRKPAGRGEVLPGQTRVVEVVKALRDKEGDGEKKEAAKLAVATEFGLSRSTVENYERMTIKRENVIERAKRRLPPNK